MEEFFSKNASAVFGLLGALGGGLISSLVTWLVKKREYDLRLWEKLLDRRIKAHENVIALAIEMRVMVPLGTLENNADVARAPQVLLSKDYFEQWLVRFTQLSMEGTTWLSTETKRELNFVQDYFVTLHQVLRDRQSDKYLLVGQLIRQDFINLSSDLEKTAFQFFNSEIRQLTLSSLNKWHKYKRAETETRVQKTQLLSRWEEVQEILYAPTR